MRLHSRCMTVTSSSHDFDFLFGSWSVQHRRLRDRLCGCAEWDEFDGTVQARPLLGGAANVDDNVIRAPDGLYRAASIRSFDRATRRWAIWWLAGQRPHHLDVPVVGGFCDGVGEFTAADTLRGKPIVVRFRWLDTDGTCPHWEQAFSPDDGSTWETNWTMTFTRVHDAHSR